MNIFEELIGNDRFASGCTTYADHFGQEFQNTRIVLPIRVGRITVPAVVDTAAVWSALNPEIVDQIRPEDKERVGKDHQYIRGERIDGELLRTYVTLHADHGENLTIEATIFVPILKPGQIWGELPNFLGLQGFLDHLRFAVDPYAYTFYFGMVED